MGKALVVYFSRSGYTRRLAEAVAAALAADVEPIVDPTNRSGVGGYLRSLLEALRRQAAPIERTGRDPGAYELVAIATPVWAGTVSSPVRAYLMENRARLPDVAFLCTMGGRGEAGAFAEMARLAGKQPRAVCALTDRQIGSQGAAPLVARFVEALGALRA